MYEKLIKCAAKTGFKIQSYIPHTHEMKTRILSKKGCLFILLPKIYQLPEYYTMFARKYFFSRIWGATAPSPFRLLHLCPLFNSVQLNFAAAPRVLEGRSAGIS